ncbi:hypothetical protein [Brenneria alni]|nr:hypothetical protein [Brenneria alni]
MAESVSSQLMVVYQAIYSQLSAQLDMELGRQSAFRRDQFTGS